MQDPGLWQQYYLKLDPRYEPGFLSRSFILNPDPDPVIVRSWLRTQNFAFWRVGFFRSQNQGQTRSEFKSSPVLIQTRFEKKLIRSGSLSGLSTGSVSQQLNWIRNNRTNKFFHTVGFQPNPSVLYRVSIIYKRPLFSFMITHSSK